MELYAVILATIIAFVLGMTVGIALMRLTDCSGDWDGLDEEDRQ